MANPKAYREIQSENHVQVNPAVTSSALRALLNHWYAMTEPDEVDIEHEWDDDSDEINGNVGPTQHVMTRKRASVGRGYNASTEVYAMYLARILPNIISSSALAARPEIQKILVVEGETDGSFVLVTNEGKTTPLISTVQADDAAFIAAITAALDTVYLAADTTVSGTRAGGYLVTFGAGLADKPIGPLTAVEIDALDTAGTVTVTTNQEGRTAGNYSHRFIWPGLCTKVPPAFTVVEGFKCDDATGLTATYKEYAGFVVNTLGLEVSSVNAGDISAELMGTGKELGLPAAAFPAAIVPVTKLTGGMLRAWYTLDQGSNWVEIPFADLRSFNVDIDAGIIETENLGGGTAVQEFQQGGENPTVEPVLVFRGDKSHPLWQAYQDSEYGTRVGLRVWLDPQTVNRKIEFLCLKAVPQCELSEEDTETRISMTLMPEWIAAHGNGNIDGPCEFNIETGVSGYNIAA